MQNAFMPDDHTKSGFMADKSIGERLTWARERRWPNISRTVVAIDYLKMPYPTYAGHENTGRGVTVKKGRFYSQKMKVNYEWLMTGHGTPDRGITDNPLASLHDDDREQALRYIGILEDLRRAKSEKPE